MTSTGSTESYIGDELELFRHAHHWKRYFSAQIRPFLGRRVLEIGAGLGGTTEVLYVPGGGRQWVCLEPDPRMAGLLQQEFENRGWSKTCEVRTGTLQDLPQAEPFDAILYIDVLEHIEDDAAELARCVPHLSAGGNLVVVSPAHQWLYSPFDKAIGHFRRYSKRTLASVAPAELRLLRLRYLDSVGVLASSANRFLMKQGMPSRKQIALWDSIFVPLSRMLDPCTFFCLGKSVLGIWQKPGGTDGGRGHERVS